MSKQPQWKDTKFYTVIDGPMTIDIVRGKIHQREGSTNRRYHCNRMHYTGRGFRAWIFFAERKQPYDKNRYRQRKLCKGRKR